MDPLNTNNDELGKSAGESQSPGDQPAWELIDVGRYRPRRIRGSYRGRELG